MNNKDLLVNIYQALGELELKPTPTNAKIITAIYTQIEKFVNEMDKQEEEEKTEKIG